MVNYWQKEYNITKTIVVAMYLAMIIYAFLVFSNIPYIERQWGQQQEYIFYGLLFEAVGVFVLSIFISNITLNSEKLREKYNIGEEKTQKLINVAGYVRVNMIILSAMGEMCAISGLIIYLLSGDTMRPWIFFIMTIAHYTITMSKLRRVREDVEQLSR